MKKFSGIDLHSNNSVIVISDEADSVLYQRRLPNDLSRIVAALAPHREELVGVVVESTYNWYWLVDGLMAQGFRARLANTTAIKKYEGLKYSGDEADAAYLAQLLRLGLLPEGYIYPREERPVRDLARKRAHLVHCRTAQILAIESIVSRQSAVRLGSRQVQRLTAKAVEGFDLPPEVALALNAHRAVIETLTQQIEAIEQRRRHQVAPRPAYRLLTSVPGIGEVLAIVILLEIGLISRFAEVGHFSSYCRRVASRYESNAKKKGEGNRKNGNKYLAWAFVEAAHFAARFCPEAKRFYERKRRQANVAVATKALAHKLARAVYHMLKTQQPFDGKRCFA